jgi:hypothetical protein
MKLYCKRFKRKREIEKNIKKEEKKGKEKWTETAQSGPAGTAHLTFSRTVTQCSLSPPNRWDPHVGLIPNLRWFLLGRYCHDLGQSPPLPLEAEMATASFPCTPHCPLSISPPFPRSNRRQCNRIAHRSLSVLPPCGLVFDNYKEPRCPILFPLCSPSSNTPPDAFLWFQSTGYRCPCS